MSANNLVKHRWTRDDQSGELTTLLPDGTTYQLQRDISAIKQYRSEFLDEEADLLDIASAVFGSDRLAKRPSGFQAGSLAWARRIQLEVPVRRPEFWRAPHVVASLCDVLSELTADTWTFKFYRSVPAPIATQIRFQPHPLPVALFSGGLDSLAGVLDLLANQHVDGLRLVSVASNSHMRHVQQEVFRALQKKSRATLEQFPFLIHHRRPTVRTDGARTPEILTGRNLKRQGHRQRARSFFYFVVATLLARRTGSDRIYVLENGVTSLNLPINPVLSSTRVTRTTHPLVLLAFEKFIKTTLNWPAFRVELPHLLQTKAEMVAPHVKGYAEIVAKTVSCARVMNGRWCGTCTACLLRRQVLWAVGLQRLDRSEQQSKVVRDIFATFHKSDAEDDRHWYFLATLDNVAELLRNPDVVRHHPSVVRTAVAWAEARELDPSKLHNGLVSLHRRYAEEWIRILQAAAKQYGPIRRLLSLDTFMSTSP